MSYYAYYPQRPLVLTKYPKHVDNNLLTSEDNYIIALACVNWNKDELVFNKNKLFVDDNYTQTKSSNHIKKTKTINQNSLTKWIILFFIILTLY